VQLGIVDIQTKRTNHRVESGCEKNLREAPAHVLKIEGLISPGNVHDAVAKFSAQTSLSRIVHVRVVKLCMFWAPTTTRGLSLCVSASALHLLCITSSVRKHGHQNASTLFLLLAQPDAPAQIHHTTRTTNSNSLQ